MQHLTTNTCLLCDEPVTAHIFGSYEVPDGRIHDRCLYALIRRELAHKHAVQPIHTRSTTAVTADPPPPQRWAPIEPTGSQRQFLALTCREALYAGGCGSGKSTALLLAALQGVDTPGYRALLLRRRRRDLARPGGLMDTADRWFRGTAAQGNVFGNTWTFPSGARLFLRCLGEDLYADRFADRRFQYIGLDDSEQFELEQYEGLLSRLRPLPEVALPVRLRATTSASHDAMPEWLYRCFFQSGAWRTVILADAADNPYVAHGATA